jgi:hypothetical protein
MLNNIDYRRHCILFGHLSPDQPPANTQSPANPPVTGSTMKTSRSKMMKLDNNVITIMQLTTFDPALFALSL